MFIFTVLYTLYTMSMFTYTSIRTVDVCEHSFHYLSHLRQQKLIIRSYEYVRTVIRSDRSLAQIVEQIV